MFSIADIQTDQEFEDEHEGEEDEAPPATAMPIRASLSITKTSGPGAVNVDMVCQEGSFSIENISYYDDAKTGTDLTAEADWNRRGLYIGPQVSFPALTLHHTDSKAPSVRYARRCCPGRIRRIHRRARHQ